VRTVRAGVVQQRRRVGALLALRRGAHIARGERRGGRRGRQRRRLGRACLGGGERHALAQNPATRRALAPNSSAYPHAPCSPPATLLTPPQGATGIEQCFEEFITAGGGDGSPFDIIQMAPASLAPVPAGGAGDAAATACRAACARAAGAGDGCQYFEFRTREAPGRRCWLRLLGVAPPPGFGAAGGSPVVLFLVRACGGGAGRGAGGAALAGSQPHPVSCAPLRLILVRAVAAHTSGHDR
jgi:hypothetical protein